MAIIAPGRRINPTIQRRSGNKKEVFASLSLTSMVDMFAMMVIFLLQSFSSEGEIIVLPPGIELPQAQNTGTLNRAPSVMIGLEEVFFENEVVGKTSDLLKSEDWSMPGLQEALRAYKSNLEMQAIVQRDLDESAQQDRERINISADKRLPFEAIKKIMYNVGFEGFPQAQLAVFPTKAPDPNLR